MHKFSLLVIRLSNWKSNRISRRSAPHELILLSATIYRTAYSHQGPWTSWYVSWASPSGASGQVPPPLVPAFIYFCLSIT